MCPACLTTVALAAASAGSAGGLTAFVVKKLRARTGAKPTPPTGSEGARNGSAQNRVPK